MKPTRILIVIVITMLFYVNSAIASGEVFYNAKDAESPSQLKESLNGQISVRAGAPLVISPKLAPSVCDFNKAMVSTYDESGKPIILCIWTGNVKTGINPDGSYFWD